MRSEELSRRRAAWTAMSELFLDTETRWYVPRVAFNLLKTGYAEAELEAIWCHEAVPEFIENLLVVAGDWAWLDFDEDRMIRRATRRGPILRLLDVALARTVAEVWKAALSLRRAMVRNPTSAATLATLWEALAHAWVEPSLQQVMFLDSKVEAIRATALTADECRESMERDFFPAYRELLYGSEEAEIEKRWQNVVDLLNRAFLQS